MITELIGTIVLGLLLICILLFRLEGTFEIVKVSVAWLAFQTERPIVWIVQRLYPEGL